MILDFESPEVPAPGHSDVCLLGAGAVGVLLATQLAEAGLSVILLEGGGRLQEQRSQNIYNSDVTGLHHQGIHAGRFRTLGGTTTQWGGQILELDEFDFEPRAHVPGSGWPLHKSDIAQFYEPALIFEGLRRVERDDRAVRASLGLAKIDPGEEFSMIYSRWCPERNFAALYERDLASDRRLMAYVHANAVGFELNAPRDAIASIRIRSFGGREATVTAERFVICLGGIESTRLLLQQHGDGIAPWQLNGLLGKHYQDHISLNGIEVEQLSPQPAFKYFGYAVANGFRYHSKIHLKESLQTEHQTLNIACTIGPKRRMNRDRALSSLRRIVREKYSPGAAETLAIAWQIPAIASSVFNQRFRADAPAWKHTQLALHCEQSPLSGSNISLTDQRDELGLFRTRLHWEVSDQEIHSLRVFTRIAATAFERTGFAKVNVPVGFFEDDALVRSMCTDSYHHMGGTRMSASPSGGIVDSDLKLHGIANAFVCSASVFPCSGFSNPTHTLLALAMRLADRLVQELPMPSQRTVNLRNTGVLAGDEIRTVELPGSGKLVPQLGFGCAYLLGPGLDRVNSRRLLDAAWDAGIRHFDVARLYGMGRTESLLAEFLREHPEATVTTKFGIKPPNLFERAISIAQRRIPRLPRRFAAWRRNDKVTFKAAEAKRSLELSLRLLGRDCIDLYLLHEATPAELVHDDLLAFLEAQVKAGKIGSFGVGGEFAHVQQLYDTRPRYARVLQFECSIFGPRLNIPAAYRIHYRTFAKPAQALSKRLAQEPGLAQRWSESVDADLDEPTVLSRLLLKASLDQYPGSLTLFSTRRDEHILENARVARNRSLAAPAARLTELLKQNSFGIGAALYGNNDATPLAEDIQVGRPS